MMILKKYPCSEKLKLPDTKLHCIENFIRITELFKPQLNHLLVIFKKPFPTLSKQQQTTQHTTNNIRAHMVLKFTNVNIKTTFKKTKTTLALTEK